MLYYKVNIIESAIITKAKRNYIFVTYNLPNMRLFMPDIPAIYTYVAKDKKVNRPWFEENQ